MKRLSALVIFCISLFSGCIYSHNQQIDVIDGGNAFSTPFQANAKNSQFSKEDYVWESWSQSTNSTTNVIK